MSRYSAQTIIFICFCICLPLCIAYRGNYYQSYRGSRQTEDTDVTGPYVIAVANFVAKELDKLTVSKLPGSFELLEVVDATVVPDGNIKRTALMFRGRGDMVCKNNDDCRNNFVKDYVCIAAVVDATGNGRLKVIYNDCVPVSDNE